MMRIIRKAIRAYLHVYYRLKIVFLKTLIGKNALSYVAYECLFPVIVLKIGKAKIGRNVHVGRWLSIHSMQGGGFENLEIGDDVYIGRHVGIDVSDTVKIGNRSGIGTNVTIITHVNVGNSLLSSCYPPATAGVEIGDDSVVNWGCIILKGTRISPNVIVLPGSVARGTLKEWSVYAGYPARLVKPLKTEPSDPAAGNLECVVPEG